MIDFDTLVNIRQSDRAYKDLPVDKQKIIDCIEAARMAPSACNSQPWKFIVVNNPELKMKVAETTSNKFIPINHFTKQAPVHVVVVNEGSNFSASLGNKIKNKDFSRIDIGIAVQNFCLKAAELGLGTCILGWFNEAKLKELLNIPEKKRVELIITLGYSNDKLREKKRKSISKIMSENSY